MNHGSFAELAFEQKMSGQELLPEEPTSPVIPSSRSKFAMLKTRVEILEKGMGELRDKWIQDIEEHLGRDTNVEPMEMENQKTPKKIKPFDAGPECSSILDNLHVLQQHLKEAGDQGISLLKQASKLSKRSKLMFLGTTSVNCGRGAWTSSMQIL